MTGGCACGCEVTPPSVKPDPVLELVTPPLDGIILPGVVRQSLLDLAQTWVRAWCLQVAGVMGFCCVGGPWYPAGLGAGMHSLVSVSPSLRVYTPSPLGLIFLTDLRAGEAGLCPRAAGGAHGCFLPCRVSSG